MRARPVLVLVGAIACAAVLAGAWRWPQDALAGWLAGAAAFASLPAGAIMLLLMMRLIPGAWGDALRLACEAGAMLTPVAALAFVPVLVGLAQLYPWVHRPAPSAFAAEWLSPTGFIARTLLWFAFLGLAGWAMIGRWRTGVAAAAGLVLMPVLAHLVAVDWLTSRDPGFASSAIGLQLLSIMALIAFSAAILLRHAVGARSLRPGVLGALLLTLLLIGAYLDFMAYLIVWSGNLPASIGWYRARGGVWAEVMQIAAVLAGWPLLLLLLAKVRRNPRWLAALAGVALTGKMLELAWFAIPPGGSMALAFGAVAMAGFCCLAAGLLPLALEWRVRRRSA
jgi:hypothetical protein